MASEVKISLGPQQTAERLFSHPNLGHETESPEDTISHLPVRYMCREGLAMAVVSVDVSGESCRARAVAW
jgi:hypothetical protein